jgi:hypothetical protein
MGRELSAFLTQIARGALYSWLFYFFVALFSSLIANGAFGVPLWQIVDADFSVLLFMLALSCAFVALALALNLIGREFVAAFFCLLLLILYAAQSTASAAAYLLYAYFDGAHLAGTSFVYDGYAHVVTVLAGWIGAGVREGRRVDYWQTIQGISTVGSCFTFLSSIIATVLGTRTAQNTARLA